LPLARRDRTDSAFAQMQTLMHLLKWLDRSMVLGKGRFFQ
jgi:hypothetical protein